MTSPAPQFEELADLVWALINDRLDAAGGARLRRLLENDAANRRGYIELMDQFTLLEWERGAGRGTRDVGRETAGSPAIMAGSEEEGSGFPVGAAFEPPRQPGTEIPGPEPIVPPVIVISPPPFQPLSTIHYPLSTNFVGGPVFSYMVSAVILAVMILGAWAYKITHYQQIAEAPPAVPSSDRPELVFVGRITGMADCRWADPSTAAFAGASVPFGRKYALSSGLMEISYITGAKVILQGPCTFEVESRRGGYLSLGKLTARIESAKPQAANPKSPNLQIPKFAVRTPTAIVTDLGTEFGVEVEQDGNTISHVFRGSVRVQVVGDSLPSPIGRRAGGEGVGRAIILGENELARVEKGDRKPSITRRAAADETGFVLAMPPPKSVRDSKAYAELVLSLNPVVYYRMERPDGATAGLSSRDDRNGGALLDKPAVAPDRVVFDLAGGGHHGELRRGNEFGSPYVPGRFGDALWLRGPAVCDRVVVPDYPKITDDQLTVSAWVMATGRTGWATIAANWGNPGEGRKRIGQFRIGLYQLDGDLYVWMSQRDGRRAEVREGASSLFPLFVWQHVALVADGTELHLYRNGEPVASCPCVGILPQPPSAGLGVGSRLNNETGTDAALDVPGYNFWQGRIDEVAIFNQALSAETIGQLYLGKPLPDHRAETTTETTKGGHPMIGP